MLNSIKIAVEDNDDGVEKLSGRCYLAEKVVVSQGKGAGSFRVRAPASVWYSRVTGKEEYGSKSAFVKRFGVRDTFYWSCSVEVTPGASLEAEEIYLIPLGLKGKNKIYFVADGVLTQPVEVDFPGMEQIGAIAILPVGNLKLDVSGLRVVVDDQQWQTLVRKVTKIWRSMLVEVKPEVCKLTLALDREHGVKLGKYLAFWGLTCLLFGLLFFFPDTWNGAAACLIALGSLSFVCGGFVLASCGFLLAAVGPIMRWVIPVVFYFVMKNSLHSVFIEPRRQLIEKVSRRIAEALS